MKRATPDRARCRAGFHARAWSITNTTIPGQAPYLVDFVPRARRMIGRDSPAFTFGLCGDGGRHRPGARPRMLERESAPPRTRSAFTGLQGAMRPMCKGSSSKCTSSRSGDRHGGQGHARACGIADRADHLPERRFHRSIRIAFTTATGLYKSVLRQRQARVAGRSSAVRPWLRSDVQSRARGPRPRSILVSTQP